LRVHRDDKRPAWAGPASLAYSFIHLVLYAGAFGGILWRPGIFVALGAFGAIVTIHLIVGYLAYRSVMSRPWPRVKPLDDNDDW
jgi:hypothetical protein